MNKRFCNSMWHGIRGILVSLIFLSSSTALFAASNLDTPVPEQIETSLNNVSADVAKNGSIEGATFTLWKMGGERLVIHAKRVLFENKRVGWFYTPLTRSLVLSEIVVVFERDHKELVRISSSKAEIQITGGKLIVSEGAEINLLGTAQRVEHLTWKLPGNELRLNGIPLSKQTVQSIWPTDPL